jgi:hypothetical protein
MPSPRVLRTCESGIEIVEIALGIEPTEFSATSKSHHDLLPIALLPIT